ncbi:MAG: hypothetical protein HOP15_02040 [Planctomycetes bacterium]|nr:hypothetical protein [Planctomycetota bacterium]
MAAVEAPVHQQTAREFLRGYYGERWPEIEAKIEASGNSLDIPYVFTPWEEVAAQFEERIGLSRGLREELVANNIGWPEVLDLEHLDANFPIEALDSPLGGPVEFDAADVAAIATLVAEKNVELAALAEHQVALVDEYLHQRWRTGDYIKAPFTTFGVNDRMGFHSQSHGGLGWAISITLTNEECPDVPRLTERIAELKMEREQLIYGYLAERYGR